MNIDEQKAFDKLSNDYDDAVEHSESLGKMLERSHQETFEKISLIASLENCSWWAVAVSFAMSFIFGLLAINYHAPELSWNSTIAIIAIVWAFSLFSYYGFWRAQYWN